MRASQQVWPLAGLLVGFSSAANLDVWKIDASCEQYRDILQAAYDDAAAMAVKAYEDLNFAIGTRDDNDPEATEKYNRIARSMITTFGFAPNPDEDEDPDEDENWEDVMYAWRRMVGVFQGTENDPANGYTKVLKPAIICDKNVWEWKSMDDPDPTDPSGGKLRDTKGNDPKWNKNAVGAWYYDGRFSTQTEERADPVCGDEKTLAYTETRVDVIQICPASFGDDVKSIPGPVSRKDSIVDGESLDGFRETLSATLVHEFAHWYGADENTGKQYVIDQQCVNDGGQLEYIDKSANTYVYKDDAVDDSNLQKSLSYGFYCISNLARDHADPPGSKNAGADLARLNADSYLYFAMMAYLDNFDWTSGQSVPMPTFDDSDGGSAPGSDPGSDDSGGDESDAGTDASRRLRRAQFTA